MNVTTPTIALTLCTALLAGCATGPNLGTVTSPENRNRTTGAVVGGLAGAVAGNQLGDSRRTTAASAAAGAVVGGLIGAQLDRQAAELRRDLDDSITVTNTGDRLLVNFPQDILFATDSASVAPSQRNELRALASNLQSYPDTRVQVIGHTDNTGSANYNFDLSARRAGAVTSVLVGSGVSGNRVTATGRGEDAPVASNLTPEGRAQNRRVEVVIRPIT